MLTQRPTHAAFLAQSKTQDNTPFPAQGETQTILTRLQFVPDFKQHLRLILIK
jgi:hypothetical protein